MSQFPRSYKKAVVIERLGGLSFAALRRYRRPVWGAAWLAAALALVIWARSLARGGPPPAPQPGLAALTIMGLILFFPWRGTLPLMSGLGRLFLAAAMEIPWLNDIGRVPGLRALAQVHLPSAFVVLCLLGALICFGAPRLGRRGIPRQRWRLRYTGVWPVIPAGEMVELSVGPDVRVSWKDKTISFPVEEVSTAQYEWAERSGWVGWRHVDHNSGLSHLLNFAARSANEAEAVAHALLSVAHQASEAEWGEWRTLIATVSVPRKFLDDGGAYDAQIERQLACPDCTAQKAENRECDFCHGSRVVKERDTVSLVIPRGSRLGKSLVVPGQGNRDANGVQGPLIATLRADDGRR